MTVTAAERLSVIRFPLERYPGFPRAALEFAAGRDAGWVPHFDPATVRLREPSADRTGLAAALAAVNQGWGNDVSAPLVEWARGERVAVVAGQQVGFAGGPLYTASKIASIVAAADRLDSLGVPALPFFWMATEDHDFDEVARLVVSTTEGVERLRSSRAAGARRSVGPLTVPEELSQGFERLTGERPSWLRTGISFRDSFAELVASAFGGRVVLVDSLMPELRRAGEAILARLADQHDVAEEAVAERTREIESRGGSPQVEPRDGRFALIYVLDRGERRPVGGEVTPAEAYALARQAPERISTGALARPLLQDYVFEPALFVGGPAEVAYYAQSSVLHERFGVPLPAVALRAHVLVAPSRLLRKAVERGVEGEELFESPEAVVARRAPEAVEQIEEAIASLGRAALPELERLRGLMRRDDASLDRMAEKSIRSIEYQMGKLRRRAELAAARRDESFFSALGELHSILMPLGSPQDRVAGWSPWWLRYGSSMIERMVAGADVGGTTGTIIGL
jgi:bacillithiol synthase